MYKELFELLNLVVLENLELGSGYTFSNAISLQACVSMDSFEVCTYMQSWLLCTAVFISYCCNSIALQVLLICGQKFVKSSALTAKPPPMTECSLVCAFCLGFHGWLNWGHE